MPPATEAEVMEAERIEAEQIPSDSGKAPPTDSKDGPPPVPESAAKQGTDGDIHPGVAPPAPHVVAPLADPPVVAGDTSVDVTPSDRPGTLPPPTVTSAAGPPTVDNNFNAGGSGDISAPSTSGTSKTLPCKVPKTSQDWFDEMSEVEQSKKRPASDEEPDDGSEIRPNLRWATKRRTLSLDRLANMENGCPVSDNLEC